MSTRTDMRDAAALAALAVCQTFGDSIKYSDHGGTAVTIYAAPGEEVVADVNVLGMEADQTQREFVIPKQTNFPPSTGIRTGAEITYPTTASYTYIVTKSQADPIGASYTVETVRTKATRLN